MSLCVKTALAIYCIDQFASNWNLYFLISMKFLFSYTCLLPSGFCNHCDSPASWECKECTKYFTSNMDHDTMTKYCSFCSQRRHKSLKYKGHNPVALPKRENMLELDLLSVICIETSHYVCFTRADDKWLFFDSMANRIGKQYLSIDVNITTGVDHSFLQ